MERCLNLLPGTSWLSPFGHYNNYFSAFFVGLMTCYNSFMEHNRENNLFVDLKGLYNFKRISDHLQHYCNCLPAKFRTMIQSYRKTLTYDPCKVLVYLLTRIMPVRCNGNKIMLLELKFERVLYC